MSSAGPSTEDLERSRYFLHEWMPPLLRQTAERDPPRVVADLGAGDGGTLWPLDNAGLVGEPRGRAVLAEVVGDAAR